MKLSDVITNVDAIRPGNAYSNDMKTGWINSLEGRVQTDIFLLGAGEVMSYDYTTDAQKRLLIEPPHDDVYGIWLQAMIDFSQGEYSAYQNTMAMFNSMWANYAAWFFNTYDPFMTRPVELGTVDYTEEAVTLYTLPPHSILTRAICRIEKAFNSGTWDELTLSAGSDTLMGTEDINATKPGRYLKTVLLRSGASGVDIEATLTKAGDDATEGRSVFYGHILVPQDLARRT